MMRDDMTRVINVDLGDRSYKVKVGSGLVAGAGALVEGLGYRLVVMVTDTNVSALYAGALTESLRSSGVDVFTVEVPAGEQHKTLEVASGLIDEILGHKPPVDRRTLVVALGGGVVGDMAGFLAAIVLRGLNWLQCPTSLLADVDASTGGKTGVDHAAGKNLVGAFHQPLGVMIDVDVLRTLPVAELANGMAECVKHAVIRDAGLLDYIAANADNLMSVSGDQKLGFKEDVMVELIARNVSIKSSVVSEDELETGVRADLNYGHTIGHALEAASDFTGLGHGEAVSLGMVAENRIASCRGLLPSDRAGRVESVLDSLGLPVRRGGYDPEAVWNIMQHDKKMLDGKTRMVLPSDTGSVKIYDDIKEEEVLDAVEFLGKERRA